MRLYFFNSAVIANSKMGYQLLPHLVRHNLFVFFLYVLITEFLKIELKSTVRIPLSMGGSAIELKIVLTLAFLFAPSFHALIENYQNSARKV